MWEIHRSISDLAGTPDGPRFARPAASSHSHRRRLMLEPLEDRALLSADHLDRQQPGRYRHRLGTSGDLRYCITQADQTQGDNTINFSVTGTITLSSALPDLSNTTGVMDIEGPGASSLTVARNGPRGRPSSASSRWTPACKSNLVRSRRSQALRRHTGGIGGGVYNEGTLKITNCLIAYNNHV